jgi:hypothetical protein
LSAIDDPLVGNLELEDAEFIAFGYVAPNLLPP